MAGTERIKNKNQINAHAKKESPLQTTNMAARCKPMNHGTAMANLMPNDNNCAPSSIATAAALSCRQTRRTPTKLASRGGRESFLNFAPLVSTTTMLLLALLSLAQHSHGAVVRPTIFSDLSPDSSQVATPVNSQQQQQQPAQPSQQAQLHPSLHQTDGPLQQQQQQQQQQPQQLASGAPQSGGGAAVSAGQTAAATKISPLKSRFCTANGARTDAPLGLQSMAIDDLALSASSFSNEQVRPHLARLNLDLAGGAWCPNKPISGANFGKEWIQVKLNKSHVITAIESQGRFGMGGGKEFVPQYQIEYSRNNGLTWHKWKDFRGLTLLRANDDVSSAVRNELSPPIVGANVIRILPYSLHLRTVCFRFELHGCQFDEGAPIAYATNDGVVEPRWGHLVDYTYDGLKTRPNSNNNNNIGASLSLLSGGLGQLVDGVKGPDNFSHNNGFEWVGWKSMNGDVIIEFTFNTLRNFTGALFHSNNLFSSGVEVFQGVDVHYGIDVPLSLDPLRDALFEQQRRRRHYHLLSLAAASQGQPRDAIWRAASEQPPSMQQQQQQQQQQHQQHTLWSSDVQSIEYEPDKKVEASRPVTVHLKQRLANKLRFVLKFASKWILVSEVEFLSQPIELMSLESVHEQQTPPLLQALTPAKSYDEYVAILREHQLRRLAADAFLGNFPQPSGGLPATSMQDDGPVQSMTSSSTTTTTSEQSPVATQPESTPARAEGEWQEREREIIVDKQLLLGAAAKQPFDTRTQQQQPPVVPETSKFFEQFVRQQMGDSGFGQSTRQPLPPPQVVPVGDATSAGAPKQMGLATVISFVLVALLVLLALLFGLSSYRLRYQQQTHAAKLARSSFISASTGTSGGKGDNFMRNVFAAAAPPQVAAHHHHHHHHLANGHLIGGSQAHSSSSSSAASTASSAAFARTQRASDANNNAGNHHHHLQQLQQHQLSDDHYNPLFVVDRRASETLNKRNTSGPLSTLKRLASSVAGGGGGCSGTSGTCGRRRQGPLSNDLLQFSGQSAPNQLLVSVRDSLGKPGKSNVTGGVNTQLIVGLNPIQHQQSLYNNGQQAHAQQQQHYSTSMSMASSSTNGGQQGDYATDYAIPDAQPIIQPFNHNHLQQQNRAFNPLIAAPGGDLRASHRSFGAQPSLLMQQQQQQQRSPVEHNYELIYGDHQPAPQQAPMVHNRTLSNQQQQHFLGLSSNTEAMLTNLRAAKQSQASPGSQNTTTTSIASNCATAATAATNGPAGGLHAQVNGANRDAPASHYYYSSTEAATRNCV